MMRVLLLSVLVFSMSGSSTSSQNYDSGAVMRLTKEYVASIEWDVNFLTRTNEFASYKKIYIDKLDSAVSQDVFLSSVMVGLLEVKEAIPKLKQLLKNDPLAKIGISFALCKLQNDGSVYKTYLMDAGRITQKAGEARSLRYLEAVNLLALLENDDFIEYATSLQRITQEAYQREIIDFAIQRHKRLSEK